MPISVICDSCGKRLRAKGTLAGRTVACPGCGTKLIIGSVDDAAAAMLLDEGQPQPTKPEAPLPHEDAPPPKRSEERPPRAPMPRPDWPREKAVAAPAIRSLPPLSSKDPPLWLRHLHWLLVLALIPLALSLLQKRDAEEDFVERLRDTIE